jgi:hypothetical protein
LNFYHFVSPLFYKSKHGEYIVCLIKSFVSCGLVSKLFLIQLCLFSLSKKSCSCKSWLFCFVIVLKVVLGVDVTSRLVFLH